jgi:hypothetical protein
MQYDKHSDNNINMQRPLWECRGRTYSLAWHGRKTFLKDVRHELHLEKEAHMR